MASQELINTNIKMKISSDEFDSKLDRWKKSITELLSRVYETEVMKNTKENKM